MNIGYFTHAETNVRFEYAERSYEERHRWAAGFHQKILVQDGSRVARILKTVAYVCVDEDEFGLPVIEKWHIKKHRVL